MPAKKKAAKKARKPARRKPAPKKKVAKKKPAARKPAARKPAAPKAPPAPPSAIGMTMHHLDYTTHNLDSVKRFYTDLLGFKSFNHDTQFNYLWIQTGHTSSLGFMPPMPEMGAPTPPREATLYFIVKDVDKAYADLAAKGIQFEGPPADMPWGHRVIRTSDPDGRSVMIATVKAMG